VVGFALSIFATLAMADTPPITDEPLRMSAFHAIFPGMQITLVIGKARNEAEKCAVGQVISGKPSSVRLVRLQAIHWPKSTGLLAVLQYAFEDANPAMVLETVHHFSLPPSAEVVYVEVAA
jgi:hypothetical protein